jgi:hypothetical protein
MIHLKNLITESVQIKKFSELTISDAIDGKIHIAITGDSMRTIELRLGQQKAESDLEKLKNELEQRYPGIKNSLIVINPKNAWFSRFKIDHPEYESDINVASKIKGDYLNLGKLS